MLVETYRDECGDGSDREIQTLANIRRTIDSSIALRSFEDLTFGRTSRTEAAVVVPRGRC
jgi:hypothetical protein